MPDHSEILDKYLSLLQSEQASADDVLERLSGEREDLVELLDTAHRVRQSLQPDAPDPAFTRNSELRILNRLRAQRKTPEQRTRGRTISGRMRLRAAPVLLSLALVLVMLFGAVGVVDASAASLPGDGLYPLKRGLEGVKLALAFDPAADALLLSEFSGERLREIEALIAAGRDEDLEGAVGEYLNTVDQLIETSQGADAENELEEFLGHQVEVLQGVKAQVPPQAQAAIQRAIDRSIQHAQTKFEDQTQEQEPAEQGDRKEQQEALKQEREENRDQDRNLNRAEQIARQYDVSPDEVLAVYDGVCEQDWKCVREHFRPQSKNK